MSHQEHYKGHTIHWETYRRGKRFGWRYQIDADEFRQCRGSGLRIEDLALAEALEKAREEIDRMKSGVPPK